MKRCIHLCFLLQNFKNLFYLFCTYEWKLSYCKLCLIVTQWIVHIAKYLHPLQIFQSISLNTFSPLRTHRQRQHELRLCKQSSQQGKYSAQVCNGNLFCWAKKYLVWTSFCISWETSNLILQNLQHTFMSVNQPECQSWFWRCACSLSRNKRWLTAVILCSYVNAS